MYSSPAVVNGVVYVGSADAKLYAFDAAGGDATCTGTPRTCSPLWTAATGSAVASSPTVANGVVYVGSDDHSFYAFDAGGTTNCSGSPKTCSPLWTAQTGAAVGSSPAVVNGVVYVGSDDHRLYAFDAAGGSANCSGTPTTCTPLWTALTGGFVNSSPAVANGVVYVGSWDFKLYAFDAAGGSATCSGTPKTCTPLWTAATNNVVHSSPAVANGVVYVGSWDDKLHAFDAAGITNCSGSPKTCSPLWTGLTGSVVGSSPALENGLVYVGSHDGKLHAFDAAGVTGCSSGTPKTCAPLWTSPAMGPVHSSPVPAGNVVYVGSDDKKLYAFGLP